MALFISEKHLGMARKPIGYLAPQNIQYLSATGAIVPISGKSITVLFPFFVTTGTQGANNFSINSPKGIVDVNFSGFNNSNSIVYQTNRVIRDDETFLMDYVQSLDTLKASNQSELLSFNINSGYNASIQLRISGSDSFAPSFLSNNWVQVLTGVNTNNNYAQFTNVGSIQKVGAYWINETFRGVQFSRITIPFLSNGFSAESKVGATVRTTSINSGSGTYCGYGLLCADPSGVEIVKFTNNLSGARLKRIQLPIVAGDIIEIRASGNNNVSLGCYWSGTFIDSYIDSGSTWLTGNPGIHFFSQNGTAANLDNWVGGEYN